ncbi:MAG: DIP1984 family protein [Nanoarchaeota archaeon]
MENKINLGEALSLLKKEKSRLARLISLRKENIYIEEGKKSPFDPKKLSEEIKGKIELIRELKIRIQNTNLNTDVKEEDISLAEAIIKVNDIRSQIGRLSDLFEKERRSWLYRDKEEIKIISQLDQSEIEKEIENLEMEKSKLDNKIQVTNWNTQLI